MIVGALRIEDVDVARGLVAWRCKCFVAQASEYSGNASKIRWLAYCIAVLQQGFQAREIIETLGSEIIK
jgi:hypothetical protein